MGDAADLALDREMDELEFQIEYLAGCETLEEALARGLIDEHGYMSTDTYVNFVISPISRRHSIQGHITCRCCGIQNLRWVNVDDKWRLFDGEKIHQCPQNPLQD